MPEAAVNPMRALREAVAARLLLACPSFPRALQIGIWRGLDNDGLLTAARRHGVACWLRLPQADRDAEARGVAPRRRMQQLEVIAVAATMAGRQDAAELAERLIYEIDVALDDWQPEALAWQRGPWRYEAQEIVIETETAVAFRLGYECPWHAAEYLEGGTPADPDEPAAPDTAVATVGAADRVTVWLYSAGSFLRRYITGAALEAQFGGSGGGGGGVSWPTADGAALADADRFAVGQLAGEAWTWVAKTGTQLKAYLKTWADGLYAGIVHAAQHGAAGADPLTPAAIGAEAAGAAAEVGAALLLHAGDTDNPHGVTAEQIEAQAAMEPASQAEMEAGTEEALRSMSPLRVAQAIDALGSGGGAVLQAVTVVDSTSYSVYNAVIPVDGSIPQISEGADYPELAVTITPQSAASKIVLRFTVNVAASTANSAVVVLAVFRDADADAVYATMQHIAQSLYATVCFDVVLPSGSTAERTYRLRTGEPNGSRYHYRNRTPGVDNHFGGAEGCSVVAMEVAV